MVTFTIITIRVGKKPGFFFKPRPVGLLGLLGFIGVYWVLLGFIVFFWVLLGLLGFIKVFFVIFVFFNFTVVKYY